VGKRRQKLKERKCEGKNGPASRDNKQLKKIQLKKKKKKRDIEEEKDRLKS